MTQKDTDDCDVDPKSSRRSSRRGSGKKEGKKKIQKKAQDVVDEDDFPIIDLPRLSAGGSSSGVGRRCEEATKLSTSELNRYSKPVIRKQ